MTNNDHNPTLDRISDFVRKEKSTHHEKATEIRKDIDTAAYPEDELAFVHDRLDANARGVETCDAVLDKLDELRGKV